MAQVSVIIATHNRAALLPCAVASAFAAGTDVEVIVVDDASTDDTPQVCTQLASVRYFRLERNSGPSHARNMGIAHSTSEYVCFLDDDDIRLPGSLDQQVRVLREQPICGWVMGQYYIGDAACQPLGPAQPNCCPCGDVFWRLFEENMIPIHTVLLRRRCVEEVGCFHPTERGTEDWDLWFRFSARFLLAKLDCPVAVYYLAPTTHAQISSNRVGMCQSRLRVLQRALQLPRVQALTKSERRRLYQRVFNALSDHMIFQAAALVQCAEGKRARQLLWTALRLHPWRAARPWTFHLLWQSWWAQRPELAAPVVPPEE